MNFLCVIAQHALLVIAGRALAAAPGPPTLPCMQPLMPRQLTRPFHNRATRLDTAAKLHMLVLTHVAEQLGHGEELTLTEGAREAEDRGLAARLRLEWID